MRDGHLSPETRLQLAPGVRTRFDAAGHVLLDAPDGTVVDLGPRGYATLSLFARPLALGEAIARLEREAPATDFAPTMNVVNMLIEEGALAAPGATGGRTSGWADPGGARRGCFDDHRRTQRLPGSAWRRQSGRATSSSTSAPGAASSPIAAARAGARRVYAVEASDIAEVAERVFAANGVHGPRSRSIPGWSRADRAARAGRPARRRDHRQRAARGGDPRDDAGRAPTPPEARRAAAPAHADAAGAAASSIPEAEARQRADRARRRPSAGGGSTAWSFSRSSTRPRPARSTCPTEAEVVGRVAARWGLRSSLAALDLAGSSRTPRWTPQPTSSSHAGVRRQRRRRHVPRRASTGPIAHTLDPWTWPTSSWATSIWVLPDAVDGRPRSRRCASGTARRSDGAPDGLTCDLV